MSEGVQTVHVEMAQLLESGQELHQTIDGGVVGSPVDEVLDQRLLNTVEELDLNRVEIVLADEHQCGEQRRLRRREVEVRQVPETINNIIS